jgi:soluble lytic murein transglycosylase-like protein
MRTFLLTLCFWTAANAAFSDIGGAPISTDFDAEFACAADMIEAGQRGQAERIFGEIVRLSGQPAWDARAAFVLAANDERRGDVAAAARRLEGMSAESIGLEPYRHLALARLYGAAGRLAEAQTEAWLAFAATEPFAARARAGLRLARLLEAAGRRREAAQALAAAAAEAERPEAEAIGGERIRLAQAAGDRATERSVALDLLLSGTAEPHLPLGARAVFRREEASLSLTDRGRRARALLNAGDAARAAKLLSGVPAGAWPAAERAANLLALAEAQYRLRRQRAAEKTLAGVPNDGTEAAFAARLFRADLDLSRLRGGRGRPAAAPDDPRYGPVRAALSALTDPGVPAAVRSATRERLVRLLSEQGQFDEALAQAREFAHETSGTGAAFEPMWKLVWQRWNEGDTAGARLRIEAIETLSPELGRSRRLTYWKARCLAREGRAGEADSLFAALAAGVPADLYAQFARRRVAAAPAARPAPAVDPAAATAIYRLPDELLRVRMFDEAGREARRLPAARGRDLRIAQAEFGLGRFFTAIAAVKRAFPQMGTAEEAVVPDAWRRLYYPIEEGGFLTSHARGSGLDTAVLRALVRQESAFDARARSKAGAIGLMQLVPATARVLSRSVLRSRYRRAFLYDPGKNASLGAAYLKDLLDQFNGSVIFALAAYNGGPATVARVIAENPGREEDELFESHPFFETRDYVRKVLLYSESYRALYP